MLVKYIGPHDAVEVAVPVSFNAEGYIVCERGKAATVPDDIGESLLEAGCECHIDDEGKETLVPVDPAWEKAEKPEKHHTAAPKGGDA